MVEASKEFYHPVSLKKVTLPETEPRLLRSLEKPSTTELHPSLKKKKKKKIKATIKKFQTCLLQSANIFIL